MLIVTVVLHHNLGINSLLFNHNILGKFNCFLRLTSRALCMDVLPAEQIWIPLNKPIRHFVCAERTGRVKSDT